MTTTILHDVDESSQSNSANLRRRRSILSERDRTESATAKRFIREHGENVRWCDPWKAWLVWDGRRWARDEMLAADALAKATAEGLWPEVSEQMRDEDSAGAKALLSYYRGTCSARGIANVLELAKSEPGIPILPDQLDAHPWLFNCDNGTVDLRTGERRPHRREDLLTKLCPHPYLPGEEGACPIWEATLDKIFAGNERLTGFVRRVLGVGMIGEVVEQILPVWHGGGGNGKSLVVETLLAALGKEYAGKMTSELLLASKGERHSTEKMDLHGLRLAFAVESDDGRRLDETTVKELTGGDTVKGRRMRQDNWSFEASHTVIMATNHAPQVRGTDEGIWRRVRLIPFTQRFWTTGKGESGPPDMQANDGLKAELRPELPGIVRWLVDACREYQRDGLKQPAEVTAATAEYRAKNDTIGEFVAECCQLAEGYTIKLADMRKAYVAWCEGRGERPASGRRLGEYLTINLRLKKHVSNGTWYSGITIQ